MIELSARDARRIAVRAQLLSRPRPGTVLEAATHLHSVQVDLTPYVAPNAELVFWSRLGPAYSSGDLDDALESGRLVEVRGYLRPAADVKLFTAEMAAWDELRPPGWHPTSARWVYQNREAHDVIVERLRGDGPLPARAIEAPFRVGWRSSGWNNTKNVPMMLERLEERGEVAVAYREGRERFWDLAERIYPNEAPVDVHEARAERDRRRLAALGIARAGGPGCAQEPLGANAAGVECRVTGTRGVWRVDPLLLDTTAEQFRGRTAVISPLDRLVFDRRRMADLFGFDYALEMYKPAPQRRWGYFALPVLHGDRLVGKVDAEADRRAGVLLVHARHQDELWPTGMAAAVTAELRSLAAALALDPPA